MFRFIKLNLAATLLASAACCHALADQADEFNPGAVVHAAIELVERDYLTAAPVVDDKLSQKWFADFLSRLDPRRVYFLKSDIQEFEPFEKRLDDLARAGSFEFAKSVRDRLQQRVMEATKHAAEFVVAQHDYSIDEAIPKQFDDYAASADELRERWRLRIKLEMLIEKTYGRPRNEVQAQLADRYRRLLQQARDMDDERLTQIYLDSYLSLVDPHARYISPTMYSSFEIGLIRTYRLNVNSYESAGQLLLAPHVSIHLIRDCQLIAIRRLDGQVIDIVEMPIEDVAAMIRWPFPPLKDDKELILEVMKVSTLKRFAVRCRRNSSRS